MKIHRIRAFSDNFIFVVEINAFAMVVDPGESAGVLSFLQEHHLKLHSILLTHCHHDHIGGAKELAQIQNNEGTRPRILGPSRLLDFDIVPDLILSEKSEFEFQGSHWQTLHLPGHTLDHLAYYEPKENILFCGDVVFSLGCGRLFEGSFEQAFTSLQKVKSLPINTQVYCAHEYTLANCNFHLDEKLTPIGEYVKIKEQIVRRLANNQDTIPTLLEFELKYNVFLKSTTVEEFTQFRSKRNLFNNAAEIK